MKLKTFATVAIKLTVNSGFFITYMGSALGTSPGRLVETNAKGDIIHEWPEDVEGTVSSLNCFTA